ncbi:unnamed protein product [Mytilus edulis]|uniref:Uncharacterized protein n=1 Tax=Mytilus edulis TaxID=6550 RepID=A0A8S3SZJ0_MYTED|nr:unnamed protein product [Mytilus edulis]
MINGLLYEVNKPITKAAKFGQNVGKLVNKLDRKLHSWSEDITWKFNGWLKQAEKQANKVKNGIVDTGKQIGKGAENAGKKVWGGIKSMFGKRSTRHMKKRCAKSCPQCDQLNTSKNKQDKVILSICGSNFVSRQKKTAEKIKDLKALYSFILKNSIVLKVEYEKKSVLFKDGKVEFKTSFVTFQNVINDQARADIVDYIVDEIDATVDEEKVLTLSCETKVNQTIRSCDECAGNICAAVKVTKCDQQPCYTSSEFNEGYWKTLDVVKKISDKVLGKLKGITTKVENVLKKAGEKIFGKTISEVASFGKKVGKEAARFGKRIGKVVKRIGGEEIFGKRSTRHLIEKRCVSSCPVCDKLDKGIFTDEQIVGKICGANFVSRQKQLYVKVRSLEDTYNYIVSNAPVVTKVEYETSSIIIVNGKLAFKKSFVTYQTNKIKRRFQLSGLFEISNIDVINDQTSTVIFDYIVAEINNTVDVEKVLTQSCDNKVNQTLKSCDECIKDICAQVPEISRPDSEHLLRPNPEMILQMINIPVPDIDKFIKEIGKRVGQEAARFGKKIGKVLQKIGGGVGRTIRKVGGVLKKLGKGVARVGKHIGQGVGRIGKHIGQGVVRLGKNIVRGVGTIGKNIGRGVGRIGKNIGRGVGRIGKNIGRGVGRIGKNIGRGVGRIGKNIGRGVGRFGKNIGRELFGKRSTRHLIAKRCVHSCPVCDVLDTNKNTDEQIVRNICGSDFVSRQQKVFDKVRGLEDTYNYIVDQPVVTKVEYETSSLIVAGGKMAFKKSFVTFQTAKIKKRFQLSGIFEFST